ncbi:unnamed protein product, partial [Scytosiphon promiscuus]
QTVELDDDGCERGTTTTAPEEVSPPQKQGGISDMEKAYIRSLAEIDPQVRAESRGLRPLLAHVPRPRLYGALAAPRGGVNGNVLDGPSTKMVPIGHKKTLVLDLDETLVSSSRKPCDCDYKIIFKIHSREGSSADDTFAANADAPNTRGGGSTGGNGNIREIHYYVRLRPGLASFLEKIAAVYELVIWTASGQSYADAIIDLIDPKGVLFSERLYRDSCTRHHNLCVKDLRRLGRPLNAVLLLDNYVYSFGLTLDNGVPISPWTGAKEAKASGLAAAYSLLHNVSRFADVRIPLITAFDLHNKIHGQRSPSTPTRTISAMASGRSSACSSSSSSSTSRERLGQRHAALRRRSGGNGACYQNPLSPVHSCSAFSSGASSTPGSPTSSSSPAAGLRGGGGGAARPVSPVAAVWAATAATRAEEERLAARREQPQVQERAVRRAKGSRSGRRQQKQQQQEEEEE